MNRKSIHRFLRYSLIGFCTFLFDLALLATLSQLLHFNPVWAAGGSFLVAVSINYVLSRRFVFAGTNRSHMTGYSYFILIAGVGALFVTASMYVLVTILGAQYLLARIGIAAVTGIWNYAMNLFFNFKVAGIHSAQQ